MNDRFHIHAPDPEPYTANAVYDAFVKGSPTLKNMTFALPEQLNDALKVLSAQRKIKVKALVAQALVEYLERVTGRKVG